MQVPSVGVSVPPEDRDRRTDLNRNNWSFLQLRIITFGQKIQYLVLCDSDWRIIQQRALLARTRVSNQLFVTEWEDES